MKRSLLILILTMFATGAEAICSDAMFIDYDIPKSLWRQGDKASP